MQIQDTKIKTRGASFIDAVVGSAIFVVVALGFLGVLQLSIREATDSKARAGAVLLANERIEEAHSFTYADVGTTTGSPTGLFVSPNTVVLNDVTYTRTVYVVYVDDPKDGVGALDADAATQDYKKIRVTVSWQARGITRNVTMVTNIVPDA